MNSRNTADKNDAVIMFLSAECGRVEDRNEDGFGKVVRITS